MRKVIVFGTGKQGKQLIGELEREPEIAVIGAADNYSKEQLGKYSLINISDKNNTQYDVIISIANAKSCVRVYEQLRDLDYKSIFWYRPGAGFIQEGFGSISLIDCKNWGDCVLHQVEMHVVDWCNLNCRGCAHFSPIFEKKMPDIHQRLQDVEKLKTLFSHIALFYILGGEPLLNPQIDRYIYKIREILPETHIVLVTNGILIPKIDKKILEVIRDNRVLVDISEYEPAHEMIDRIIAILKEYEIRYHVRPYDRKLKFNKPLSLSDKSVHKWKCLSTRCVSIYEGKVARCPTLMYIKRFNEVFQRDLPDEGIIDLNDVSNGKDLLNLLERDVPLCRHCIECEIPWSRCSTDISVEDFAVID